jgi:hypothetical protein
MNRNLNIALAFAAGLLGGVASRWLVPTPVVLAQTQAPAPKDVRAQRFTLVNEDGAILGMFGIDQGLERVNGKRGGNPVIKLFDQSGKETWSAGGSQIRTLSGR